MKRQSYSRPFTKHLRYFGYGLLWYGNYWDHLLSWYYQSYYNPNKFLLIYYEDLLINKRNLLIKIANFMNIKEKYNMDYSLNINKLKLDMVDSNTNFKKMSNEFATYKTFSTVFGKHETFFRNGKSNDWKNYFSNEWSDEFDNITFVKFCGTNIKYFKQLPKKITKNRYFKAKL